MRFSGTHLTLFRGLKILSLVFYKKKQLKAKFCQDKIQTRRTGDNNSYHSSSSLFNFNFNRPPHPSRYWPSPYARNYSTPHEDSTPVRSLRVACCSWCRQLDTQSPPPSPRYLQGWVYYTSTASMSTFRHLPGPLVWVPPCASWRHRPLTRPHGLLHCLHHCTRSLSRRRWTKTIQ